MSEQKITPKSSNIASYAYSPKRSALTVEFKNGDVWEYEKIPPAIFEAMKRAASVGKFLHERVKGHYDARKLDPSEQGEVMDSANDG